MLNELFICLGICGNEICFFKKYLTLQCLGGGYVEVYLLFSSRWRRSTSFYFLLPALLGLLGFLWDSGASTVENAPYSLRRWASSLGPGCLRLRALLLWIGSGRPWDSWLYVSSTVFLQPETAGRAAVSDELNQLPLPHWGCNGYGMGGWQVWG